MRRAPCTVSALLALTTLSLMMTSSTAFAQREWRTDYTPTELATGSAIISCVSTPLITTSSGNQLIEQREQELKDDNERLQELLSWMEAYLPENQQALAQAFGLGQGEALNDLLMAFGHKGGLSVAQQRALRAQRHKLWAAQALTDRAKRASTVYAIIHEVLQPTTTLPAVAQTTAQSARQAQ